MKEVVWSEEGKNGEGTAYLLEKRFTFNRKEE